MTIVAEMSSISILSMKTLMLTRRWGDDDDDDDGRNDNDNDSNADADTNAYDDFVFSRAATQLTALVLNSSARAQVRLVAVSWI